MSNTKVGVGRKVSIDLRARSRKPLGRETPLAKNLTLMSMGFNTHGLKPCKKKKVHYTDPLVNAQESSHFSEQSKPERLEKERASKDPAGRFEE